MPTHNTLDQTGVTVATSDATVTTLATVATRSNETYTVTAWVTAVETSDYDEVAGYVRVATFKNDGGTLSLVGAVSATHTAEDTAGWNCTLDANGTNIRVRVTGAAATNIIWRGDLKVNTVGWRSVQGLNAP